MVIRKRICDCEVWEADKPTIFSNKAKRLVDYSTSLVISWVGAVERT